MKIQKAEEVSVDVKEIFIEDICAKQYHLLTLVQLFLGELNKPGDRLLVARGGVGGSVVTSFLPAKGQAFSVHLDLKLIADVGLVG